MKWVTVNKKLHNLLYAKQFNELSEINRYCLVKPSLNCSYTDNNHRYSWFCSGTVSGFFQNKHGENIFLLRINWMYMYYKKFRRNVLCWVSADFFFYQQSKTEQMSETYWKEFKTRKSGETKSSLQTMTTKVIHKVWLATEPGNI